MEQEKNIIGNEIFERIKEIGRKNFESALEVRRKLADDRSIVSDGELLDAFFTLYTRLDLANPLLPLASEIFQRYMLKIGMEKTPSGFDREWFHDNEDWSENLSD
jgi:hypothetical protein